jgi:ATP/maltotriose-dependent transcriptional regulator MalT/DNA-binding SARP family transcriptional activator
MTEPASFVTQTKVVIPRRRTDLFLRQRLVGRCQSLLKNKLTTVTAPAGYGKTSLLIDVVHQSPLPGCWFSLDRFDNHFHRFVIHFFAAISAQFPDISAQLAVVEDLDLTALVGLVVNAVYQHISKPFMLVLDDFHLITNPSVVEFVDLFLQQVDDNCRLVVSSRELVTLPNGLLLVGRSVVAGLGPRDLAFQPDEIQTLFLQNYRTSISQQAAKKLSKQTEGWITGLLLSTQTLLDNVSDRFYEAQISGQSVYDYLANQVLLQQPAEVQDFLLRTSLLEEFNADFCEQIFGPLSTCGEQTWHNLTELVVQNNLFVLPVDNRITWFRYHQLFRDFLQNRIMTDRRVEAEQILQKVAEVSTANGQWEKAQSIYIRLGDLDAVARLIEYAGLQLVRDGRFTSLREWIKSLSVETLHNRPVVLALSGYADIMQGKTRRALTTLNQAIAALETENDLANLVRALVWRSGARRLLGEYPAALQDVDRAMWLARTHFQSQTLHALALKALAQYLITQRKTEKALVVFEESLAMYKSLGDEENIARLYLETGVAHLTWGRYDKAVCRFDRALVYYNKTGNTTRLADLFNNWAVLHYLTGNYLKAIQMFEQTLDYARQSAYIRMEAYAMAGSADVYLDLEALEAAENTYNRAHRVGLDIDEKFFLTNLELNRAAVARKRNDLALAQSFLADAAQLVSNQGSDYEQGLYCMEAGLLAQADGRVEDAKNNLELAVRKFEDTGRQVERSRAYLDLAFVNFASGQADLALQQLDLAIKSGLCTGNLHPLSVAAQRVMPLLDYAGQLPDHPAELDQLLAQIKRFKRSVPHFRRVLRRHTGETRFVKPRLIINLLGNPEIVLDGTMVSSRDRLHRQARQLFYFLLSEPSWVTKERIGYQLWPNASTDQLNGRFKNTVYQVRQIFGEDSIIRNLDSGWYAFNREFDYECDVELFEWYLTEARNPSTPEANVESLLKAIDLYRGPYLIDVDGLWVLPERQRLQDLYLSTQLKLARLFFEARNYELALEHCRKLLETTPSHEPAHRMAMRAYGAMGDRGAVVRQFEACRKALKDDVDLPVSAETRALCAMLLH